MGKGGRRGFEYDLDKGRAFNSCGRKRKFKSNEATKVANRFGQRKYECHICGHWHLTKAPKGEMK